MTETTARIRWQETSLGEFAGRVGTLRWLAFQMRPPAYDGGAWQLTSYIPGSIGNATYYDDREDAEAEAERWLAEFVSSLGASFTEPLSDSQRFQVSEARDLLALWDENRGLDGRNYSTERTLADHLRNMLAIIEPADDKERDDQ
jgi:hypothetical protein